MPVEHSRWSIHSSERKGGFTMTACRQFLVSGRVQGVNYRASARNQALQLGLTGWIRNRPDGRVEARAWGDEDDLDHYQQWLASGPPAAQVSNVERRDLDPNEPPSAFRITG